MRSARAGERKRGPVLNSHTATGQPPTAGLPLPRRTPPLPRDPRASGRTREPKRPPRNHYIDLLKGLAALNIVFIHTVFNSGVDYVPGWVRAASLAIDVPFFFFLSGWAVASMPAITARKTATSLWRIYSQWTLFVLVTFAAMAAVALLTSVSLGSRRDFAASFVGNLVLQNPTTPLPFHGVMGGGWFLVVYFAVIPVMSAAIALVRRNTNSLGPIALLLLVCAIGFVRVQSGGSFFFFDQYFLCYSGFFLLGYLQRDLRLRPLQSLTLIGLSLAGLWFTLALRGVHFIDMQALKFAPTLPWVFFSMLAIIVAMSGKRWQYRVSNRGPLAWVGKHALAFFFTNAVAASLVMFIAPLIQLPWGLKLAICYGITLGFTAALVVTFNHLHALTSRGAGRLHTAVRSSLAAGQRPVAQDATA
ncbi:acyltransferase family protein [Modestobacter sp. SYSU DS0657]